MTPRLYRVLVAGTEALDALGLRYALVGGLAVSAWGHVRATRDVDLHAELPSGKRAALRDELVRRGFDVPAMDAELQRCGLFRSLKRREKMFLDIFDAVGPLGEAILAHRRAHSIEGRSFWFASVSDLLVLKVFSDRARDHDDLVALLALPAKDLDLDYLRAWAGRLDQSIGGDEVSERLESAIRKASGT
jgi:hypothetical protein